MMGERLKARAAAVAERRCRAVRAELAREIRQRGLDAEADGQGVRVAGRELWRRWLSDPNLRFAGWMR